GYVTADPPLTDQITNGSLVNGDTFSGTLTRDPGTDVGTYAVRQGSLALNTNYSLTLVGANLKITQAPTVTSLSSSLNPSAQGQTVIFTAQVQPVSPGVGTPSGLVEF